MEAGRDALAALKPSDEDRGKAETWLAGLGIAVAQGAKDDAQGYHDALSLMAAKYAVRTGIESEKALWRTLAAVGKIAVAALAS